MEARSLIRNRDDADSIDMFVSRLFVDIPRDGVLHPSRTERGFGVS